MKDREVAVRWSWRGYSRKPRQHCTDSVVKECGGFEYHKSLCLETEEDLKDELEEVGKSQGSTEVIFSPLSTLYFTLMAMRNHIRWSNLSDSVTNWTWGESRDGARITI